MAAQWQTAHWEEAVVDRDWWPSGLFQMDVFDAAELYKKESQQVIVLAGKDYGSGSSRDWAAKGPWMLVSLTLLPY